MGYLNAGIGVPIHRFLISGFDLILNIRKQADSAPLMTRAMREVREESEMYKYDKVSTLFKLHLRMLFKAKRCAGKGMVPSTFHSF